MKKRETTPDKGWNASAESLVVVNHTPRGLEPELAESVQEQVYPSLVKEFLGTWKNKDTYRSYRNGIKQWTSWCDANGIQPLSATREDATRWADHLGSSSNRSRLAGNHTEEAEKSRPCGKLSPESPARSEPGNRPFFATSENGYRSVFVVLVTCPIFKEVL
jgi:hypothetical protein